MHDALNDEWLMQGIESPHIVQKKTCRHDGVEEKTWPEQETLLEYASHNLRQISQQFQGQNCDSKLKLIAKYVNYNCLTSQKKGQ